MAQYRATYLAQRLGGGAYKGRHEAQLDPMALEEGVLEVWIKVWGDKCLGKFCMNGSMGAHGRVRFMKWLLHLPISNHLP